MIKINMQFLMQKNFQSKINLLNETEGDWYGTKICKKKSKISTMA